MPINSSIVAFLFSPVLNMHVEQVMFPVCGEPLPFFPETQLIFYPL